MKQKDKFLTFLEALAKKSGKPILCESIAKAYKILHEAEDEYGNDLGASPLELEDEIEDDYLPIDERFNHKGNRDPWFERDPWSIPEDDCPLPSTVDAADDDGFITYHDGY